MQMHESKASTTRSSSTSSSIKISCTSNSGGSSGGAGVNNNLPSNNQVTSSANNNSTADKRARKKSNRDKQPINDDKSAPTVMSNLSSYSLIDDDHIDDQETINVGNLIIDLESDLEKEKIENEQANNTVSTDINAKCNTNLTNAPSSTSQTITPSSSSSLVSATNKSSNISSNNNNIKSLSYNLESKPVSKSNQKSVNKHPKDSGTNNVSSNPQGVINNNGHVTTRTVFKSSADERGELKMKITRETKPGKSEHKIVTSPSQKSPTSCSSSSSSSSGAGINNNNSLSLLGQINSCEDTNETLTTQTTSSISSTKECGTSTSIGTITEPECLGPCEPGTSVTLEGIVWQETDGGILVVNVTWRGKTYVGALLDCTRHDWAPPRLCDSPTSDIDAKASKGVRAKRIITRSNGIGLDEKNLLQTTGKLRNGKGRRIPSTSDPSSCNKKQREASDKSSSENPSTQSDTNTPQASMSSTISETTTVPMDINTTNSSQPEPVRAGDALADGASPNSPMLIGCNEPNCSKKYRNMNGLLYHQSHAHSSENDSSNNQDDCSSSTKDKVKKPAIDEPPTNNLSSPNEAIEHNSPSINEFKGNQNDEREQQQQSHQMQHMLQSQGQKRGRSPSPEGTVKITNKSSNESIMHHSLNDTRVPRNESPRISYVKGMDPERRHSSSSNHSNVPRGSDARRSPNNHQRHQSYDSHGSSSLATGYHIPPPSPFQTSKTNSHSSKQPIQQQQQQQPPPPPLPATTEEGMKPSGTSTGPPPAPHQANCYFNPAFLANTFNPYGLPPYFPRHMYDQITPPTVPTSNAAFLTRFMNNMRIPPPPDSPSRLLSPSMPKNVPFPPFKIEHGVIPPALPNSHPLPNLSPMSNPSMPPGPLPAMPPLPLPGSSANLRIPSQADPLLPPSSQPPFLPPTGMNPALGLPGIGNPLGPMVGPQVPNLVDDTLAKQFPRRFN